MCGDDGTWEVFTSFSILLYTMYILDCRGKNAQFTQAYLCLELTGPNSVSEL